MAVSSVNGNYANTSGVGSTTQMGQAPASSTLDMDSFMQLLSVQLQNQDINNPMSNSEMMQQLTSMATVQSMNTFSELSSTQYAMGLMGQEVTVATTNKQTGQMEMKTGKVIGINVSTMKLYLENDDAPYGLGNVMEVGKVPQEKEDEKDDEDGESENEIPWTDIDPKKKNNSNVQASSYMVAPASSGSLVRTEDRKTSDSVNTAGRNVPENSFYAGTRLRTEYLKGDKLEAMERRYEIPEDKKAVLAKDTGRKATGPALGLS